MKHCILFPKIKPLRFEDPPGFAQVTSVLQPCCLPNVVAPGLLLQFSLRGGAKVNSYSCYLSLDQKSLLDLITTSYLLLKSAHIFLYFLSQLRSAFLFFMSDCTFPISTTLYRFINKLSYIFLVVKLLKCLHNNTKPIIRTPRAFLQAFLLFFPTFKF